MKTAHQILISRLTIADQCDISSFTLERIKDAMIEFEQQTADMYKECLEQFISTEKCDEANAFLSSYGSGLAKDLQRRER